MENKQRKRERFPAAGTFLFGPLLVWQTPKKCLSQTFKMIQDHHAKGIFFPPRGFRFGKKLTFNSPF